MAWVPHWRMAPALAMYGVYRAYFDRMEGKPPRDTTMAALDAFDEIDPADAPLALDLGCGDGRDTLLMLERGWRVWALDAHPEGLRRLRERPECAKALGQGRLEVVQAEFGQIDDLPPARLVNASFSLPFCPPGEFRALWGKITGALGPGGRFAGQFFGDRDDWAILEDRTHLTRRQIIDLFPNDVLERFIEEDRPSNQPDAHKHWHVFHIVSRRRDTP